MRKAEDTEVSISGRHPSWDNSICPPFHPSHKGPPMTAFTPRTLDTLRIADDDLRAALEGRRHLLFDGGMGTMLQAAGLEAGALPELLNLSEPDAITAVHAAYVAAGSEVVTTNTFGANAHKLGDAATVEEIFDAAVRCARASGARYVAGDIGPWAPSCAPWEPSRSTRLTTCLRSRCAPPLPRA